MADSPTVHSKLGASSYYRWKACPGSVRASEGIISESSIYADEGTLAHDIAAKVLLGKISLDSINDEMADAINVYLDHIDLLVTQKPTFRAVEQRLDLTEYHPALFGTADYVAYYDTAKTLRVVDYKHGAGIPVEVENSTQLMYYGLGALHMNKFPIERVVLTIVQPRCYHPDGPIRSWETDPVTMLEFAAQLIDDAHATENPNAPLIAGDHCRFCPAQPTCPEANRAALAVVKPEFTAIQSFDMDQLAKALTLIPQIKAWCKSVDEFAYKQAMLGDVPPGFKLVDKRANRRWKDDFAPKEGFGGVDWYDKKLKSPAQIEKLLAKEKRSLLDDFIIKESSGKTLVPICDDRQPLENQLGFSAINDN